MGKLDPIMSEFATSEEVEAHDAWVRRKVRQAMASPEPSIPHHVVTTEVRALLDQKSKPSE